MPYRTSARAVARQWLKIKKQISSSCESVPTELVKCDVLGRKETVDYALQALALVVLEGVRL